MSYKRLFFALAACVWCFAASVAAADVIPLRPVIACERMFFDRHEFCLSGHAAVDMAVVMVIKGQIRYVVGDGNPDTGFTLDTMNSIILNEQQAVIFRGVSLIPDTEVRFIYFGKDRTQANLGK